LDLFEKSLTAALLPHGIQLDEHQLESFRQYYALTMAWNEKMNLTAIVGEEAFAVRNIADSLMLLVAGLNPTASVIDVGTGAGLPGIPLKIMCPSLRLTMIDSHAKKLSFVDAVCSQLGFTDVELISARAETLAHQPEYREVYDAAVSRAVAAMPVLCELCIPFVRPSGVFYAMKSLASAPELLSAEKAAIKLGGGSFSYFDYTLSDGAAMRIAASKKLNACPDSYPRAYAKIKKAPL